MAGTVTALETTDILSVLGEALRPLLTNDMGSSIEIFDTSGPAGAGPPPHSHPWEEIYVVVEGELEVAVDDEPHVLRKGAVAHVPAGTVHAYRNVTEAHFLTIVSQGNAAKFFAQVADEVEMSPPDLPGIVRVGDDHGVTFAS